MRRAFLVVLTTVLTTTVMAAVAMAQTAVPPDNRPQGACPPDLGTNPPTLGQDTSKPLSDQLAESKGVICPPAGVDPGIGRPPPEGGTIKVVPPPGSPGGNPTIQPK
jgi:hypothetical protein